MGRSGGMKKNIKSGVNTKVRARLKASDEAVAELQEAVLKIDSEALRDRYRSGNFPNNTPGQDVNRRYRWDLVRAAVGDERIYEITKKEGLKDAHMDSVLKHIIPPLSEEVDLKEEPEHLKGKPLGQIKVRPNVIDPNDPRLGRDEKGEYITLGEDKASQGSAEVSEDKLCHNCQEKKYDGSDLLCSICRIKKNASMGDHRRGKTTSPPKVKPPKEASSPSAEKTDEVLAEDKVLEEFGY